MALNNWLCKHFDKDKKGYVNIGDILSVIFSILFNELSFPIYLIVGFGTVGAYIIGDMVYNPYNALTMSPYNASYDASIKHTEPLKAILTGYAIYISIIIIVYAIYKICQIKIAKCSLKGDKS